MRLQSGFVCLQLNKVQFLKAILFFTCMCIAVLPCISTGAEYYVKTSGGSDSNDGTTLETAFATPHQAAKVAVAGDQVWVKGGTYMIASAVKFSNSGTDGNLIKFFAVAGETPIFDGTNGTGRGIEITKDYIHVKGITIQYVKDRGVTVKNKGVILEGLTVHNCDFDGICLTADATQGATDCLVLNCDSYLNWESGTDGNNGDGFSAKDGGTGNIFRGCRAWLNADDGWDTYGNTNAVLIDSCWAFRNGYNIFGYTGTWSGNGNGFKLGAAGDANGENVIVNSFAFGNTSKGFDQNSNVKGLTVINCTGYMNFGALGNFAFPIVPTAGTLMKHVLKNNLSIPYGTTVSNTLAAGSEEVTNSWNLGLTLSESDFVSLDTSLATKSRDANYRLPDNGLFKLAGTNSAINKGTPVTYTFNSKSYTIVYNSSSPDLGALEYSGTTSVISKGQRSFTGSTCNVATGNNSVVFTFGSPVNSGRITICDILGKTVFTSPLSSATSFTWNCTSQNGLKTATGSYLANISIQTASGTQSFSVPVPASR